MTLENNQYNPPCNLDIEFASFVLPKLRKFREINDRVPKGFNLNESEWNIILDKMIYAFEYASGDIKFIYQNEESDHIREIKVSEGLELFCKYYFELWS